MFHKLFSTLWIVILFGMQSYSVKAIDKSDFTNNPPSSELLKKSDSIIIHQFNFENQKDSKEWVSEKGTIGLSKKHYKDGENSLVWDWKKKDYLVVAQMQGLNKATQMYPGGVPEFYETAYYPKGMYGGLKMWLYQEEAQNGNMIFQVGSDVKAAKKNPKYKFEVNMNFKGWRAVWVNFEEDAKVENYKGNATMKSFVSFPSKELKGKGKLFIDRFLLLDFVSYKRHSDMQFKNHKKDTRVDTYKILTAYQNYLNDSFEESKITSLDFSDSKLITEKLEYLILGGKEQLWKNRNSGIEKQISSLVEKSKKTYKKLDIKKEGNSIVGVPLFSSRDEHISPEGANFQDVGQATLFPMAMDYRINQNEDQKKNSLMFWIILKIKVGQQEAHLVL
jgi:chondroitin-sulfate-ABC endolyase/exolyase